MFSQCYHANIRLFYGWVDLIMRCVSSVSYSFRINQSVFGDLKPERGLRQGDPLSPYLFTLCAQGLSTIISNAAAMGLFKSVKIARGCPMVSHLFFADDNLVFFRATLHDIVHVKKCIQDYEETSGHVVNYEKSAITFSPSSSLMIPDEEKQVSIFRLSEGMIFIWDCIRSLLEAKRYNYLRFVIGFLKESMDELQNCSQQGTRRFSLRLFFNPFHPILRPVSGSMRHCEIEQLCAKFWWNSTNDKNRIHWAKWQVLCKPKQLGGMRFLIMIEFNKVLVAKQVWRIIHNPDSLMARILKARNFRNVDILEAPRGSQPSYI